MRPDVTISSDGLSLHEVAVEASFASDVNYGQVTKSYEADPIGPGRYSAPKVKQVEKVIDGLV